MFRFASSRRIFAALLGVMVSAVFVSSVLAATLTRGGGAVTAVRTATASDAAYTNATTVQAMPGMSVKVGVPANQRTLLVITFSAQGLCYGSAGFYCHVLARVDGQTVTPGEVAFSTTGDQGNAWARETNSMQFVAGPLAAGQHTVDIGWRVDAANATFYAENRTLTVLRSKL